MDISVEKCEAFKKNPTVNPLTGRKIQLHKIRHTQLTKACEAAKKNRRLHPKTKLKHLRLDR